LVLEAGDTMAILIECPKCRTRYGETERKKNVDVVGKQSFTLVPRRSCGSCAYPYKSGKLTYWIEYYSSNYRRKRERIGPNRAAAEHRLREVMSLRTEGRYINRVKDPIFDHLADWYINLETIKEKKSCNRDALSIRHLKKFFCKKRISEITADMVKTYRIRRLKEMSHPARKKNKQKTRPATVNREVACLKRILNMAADEKNISIQSLRKVKPLEEDNVRKRYPTEDELKKLFSNLPPHARQIVVTAFYSAMRLSELMKLTWDRVDLERGLIHLRAQDTKTTKPRDVPIHPYIIEMLNDMKKRAQSENVFTYNGKPIKRIARSFRTACRNAGIDDLWIHDFRHICITNWRMEGHDFARIMAASGHTTTSTFLRYNIDTEEDIKKLVQSRRKTPIWTPEDNLRPENTTNYLI
jgi:integrase